MNLVNSIKELEKEVMLKEKLHKEEMAEMHNLLQGLRKYNTACEKCYGTGSVKRPKYEVDGWINFNEYEELVCNACNGTGKRG